MPFRPLPILAAALCVLLAGCQTAKVLIPPNLRAPTDSGDQLSQAQQQLLKATPCCGSFADFSYQNLLPFRPKKFELGPNSPVANLNGVHSYFLAFRLPPDAKLPYDIALKSDLRGRWLHNSYIFAPTTVVLDDGFQPITSHDVKLCEYMGWSSTGAYGSVHIADAKARYLVVYSSAEQQSGKTYWEQSPATFSADAPVKMASDGSFKIPHGPDGTIYIGMMNASYSHAIDNAICGEPPTGDGLLKTLRTTIPLPWSSGESP